MELAKENCFSIRGGGEENLFFHTEKLRVCKKEECELFTRFALQASRSTRRGRRLMITIDEGSRCFCFTRHLLNSACTGATNSSPDGFHQWQHLHDE
jgi:hypothetical protein